MAGKAFWRSSVEKVGSFGWGGLKNLGPRDWEDAEFSSSWSEDEKSIFWGSLGFRVKVEVEGLERMVGIGCWSESGEEVEMDLKG